MADKPIFEKLRSPTFAYTSRRAVTTGLFASVAVAACRDDISAEDAVASPAAAASPPPPALLTPSSAPVSTASGNSSVPFVDVLLGKPAIAAPADPFVTIFHIPDRDGGYPFYTGAPMTREAWGRVYGHVGHLGPYDLFRLSDARTALWDTTDKVPFEVAQSMGRPTGGGFYLVPSGSDEDTARRIYRDPIGLNVTHWIHDDEHAERTTAWLARVKQWYVDEMLAPRRTAGKAAPKLVTNWETDNAPYNRVVGGLAGLRSIGFTAGNWQYYSYRTDSGADVLREIFVERPKRQRERFGTTVLDSTDEASRFGGAYIGIASDNGNPTPMPAEEWASAITIGTLEGMRSYFVFTPQSDGTLGPGNASSRDRGIFNANSIYAMALAASRFESTKNAFKDSSYAGDTALQDKSDNILFRSRRNGNAMWFAGVAFSGNATVRVQTPTATGTLTNLATGERAQVSGGVASVRLTRIADLYHFSA